MSLVLILLSKNVIKFLMNRRVNNEITPTTALMIHHDVNTPRALCKLWAWIAFFFSFFRVLDLLNMYTTHTNTIVRYSVDSYCHLTIGHRSQKPKMVDFGSKLAIHIYEMFDQVRNLWSFEFLLCIIINAHFSGIMDCEIT